jgi:hypothetical protein
MTNTQTINGFYGHLSPNPCEVFIYENRNGSKWYVVEGGTMVNKTFDDIPEGQNVEELSDVDVFTWSGPINSIDELIEAVEN